MTPKSARTHGSLFMVFLDIPRQPVLRRFTINSLLPSTIWTWSFVWIFQSRLNVRQLRNFWRNKMRKRICGLISLNNARAVSIAAQDDLIDKQVAKARPSVLTEAKSNRSYSTRSSNEITYQSKARSTSETKLETTSPENYRKSKRSDESRKSEHSDDESQSASRNMRNRITAIQSMIPPAHLPNPIAESQSTGADQRRRFHTNAVSVI